jgi:hypothetical protein
MRNLLLTSSLITFLSGALFNVHAQNVGMDVPTPLEKLDIAGRLRLSSDITAGAPTGGAGTIRWNAADGQFQGWDGIAWVSFFPASETDPVFSASPSFGIAGTDITNWNTAFGWGDHSTAGYLTSFTETDPIFSASPSFSITGTDITNWNTAFGWGDHALAGYLTSFTELDPTWDGAANFTGDINRTGNVGIGGAPSEKLHVTGNVRSTAGFIANDGTAGTPSFRFANSPTTGIYRPANDAVGISTAGIERVRVAAGGNVGIGVVDISNNPVDASERLQVTGNVLLSRGADRTIAVQSALTSPEPGRALTVKSGDALNDAHASLGGHLTLAAGWGNVSGSKGGGDLILRSGANFKNNAGGDIILETGSNNSAMTEHMRIAHDGDITLPELAHGTEDRLLTISAATGQLALSGIVPSTVGTVTSVGLSLPAIFTVSNSPVTVSGTLTGTLATQTANTTFAGPATGAAAAPTFRALVAADIPNLDASKITTGILPIARGGTNSGTALVNNRVMISSGGSIVENAALTANLPVYTTASGTLTTTAPATGVQGYWTRTGTLLHNTTLTDNVGIGVATPIKRLDILTGTSSEGMVVRSATTATNVAGHIWPGSGGFVIDARLGNLTGAANLHLRTGGTDRIFIRGSNGNVGIQNSDPQAALHVTGDFYNQEIHGVTLNAIQDIAWNAAATEILTGGYATVVKGDGTTVTGSAILVVASVTVSGNTITFADGIGGYQQVEALANGMASFTITLQRRINAGAWTSLISQSALCGMAIGDWYLQYNAIPTMSGIKGDMFRFPNSVSISYFDTPANGTVEYRLTFTQGGFRKNGGNYRVTDRNLTAVQIKR